MDLVDALGRLLQNLSEAVEGLLEFVEATENESPIHVVIGDLDWLHMLVGGSNWFQEEVFAVLEALSLQTKDSTSCMCCSDCLVFTQGYSCILQSHYSVHGPFSSR